MDSLKNQSAQGGPNARFSGLGDVENHDHESSPRVGRESIVEKIRRQQELEQKEKERELAMHPGTNQSIMAAL